MNTASWIMSLLMCIAVVIWFVNAVLKARQYSKKERETIDGEYSEPDSISDSIIQAAVENDRFLFEDIEQLHEINDSEDFAYYSAIYNHGAYQSLLKKIEEKKKTVSKKNVSGVKNEKS